MEVDMDAPAATREHQGTTYYFCSAGCAEAFAKRPEDYITG
jgi:Cu+-exporting ATPase